MPEPHDGLQHRPLPSVGIPLLRDEVRASRARRVALVVLAGVAVVGVVGFVFVRPLLPELLGEGEAVDGSVSAVAAGEAERTLDPAEGEDPVAAAADPVAEVETPPPTPPLLEEAVGEGSRSVHRFGAAAGFRPALTGAGLTGAEADALTVALTGVMDFRRCRPDHEMVVERDGASALRGFEYRASTTQIYRVERDDEGALRGRQVEVPIERVRVRRAGVIEASLGAALEAAGLGRSLVGVFVETFDRQVNFNTDTRAGDTFRIVVEEERIGGELLRYGTVHAIEVRGQRLGHRQAFWFAPREGAGDFFDETGRAVHGGWLRTPLHFDHVSSPFDPRRRHPILRRIVPHNGVDYAAGTGTPVWAAADGSVSFVGARGANGNLVSLRHENGYESHYAHLSRFASGLSQGDRVAQRQVIGYVGSTGRSTGPHLHFGLERGGRFVDPQTEINGPGRMMPAANLARFRRQVRVAQAELAGIELTAARERPPEPVPEPVD